MQANQVICLNMGMCYVSISRNIFNFLVKFVLRIFTNINGSINAPANKHPHQLNAYNIYKMNPIVPTLYV